MLPHSDLEQREFFNISFQVVNLFQKVECLLNTFFNIDVTFRYQLKNL